MKQTARTSGMSDLGGYSAHAGLVTTVLVTLAAITWMVGMAGHPVVAVGFYVLAVAVASPLLADELRGIIDWLF